MKLIDLEQGTEPWKQWRRGRICGTDASIICGLYPYKTVHDLWLEKQPNFIPEPANEAMLRGNALEPEARQLFIEVTGIQVAPAVVEYENHSWAGASLDGLSRNSKTLLEIKCPGQRNHLFSLEIGILEYWQVQIQHQFFVTGADICYFMSYNPDFEDGKKYIIRKIFPDWVFIEDMVAAERYFYDINMSADVEPEKLFYMD